MIKYIYNMKRAFKSGVLFPNADYPKEAPFGSTETPVKASFLRRLKYEKDWFRISRHRLSTADIETPLSILHITDVHLRTPDLWLKKLCEAMMGLSPDIVALTGDIVAPGWKEEAFDLFMKALPKGRLGRFAVMGNWDIWATNQPEKWLQRYKKHNVELLINSWKPAGEWCIAGVDDLLAGKPTPQQLIKTLPSKPTLMLNHCPALFRQLAVDPIRLVLSGHAHGGQVRLPLIGPLWTPKGSGKTVAGWSKRNDTHLFVSRGVGWSVAPIRILCPPELAWIDISPE